MLFEQFCLVYSNSASHVLRYAMLIFYCSFLFSLTVILKFYVQILVFAVRKYKLWVLLNITNFPPPELSTAFVPGHFVVEK